VANTVTSFKHLKAGQTWKLHDALNYGGSEPWQTAQKDATKLSNGEYSVGNHEEPGDTTVVVKG
jgi:hypothetical protein